MTDKFLYIMLRNKKLFSGFMCFAFVGVLSSCVSATSTYEKKIKYDLNQPIHFPDLTLTCIESGEKSDKRHGITLFRKFRITTPKETVFIIYRSSCMDHNEEIATDCKIFTLDLTPAGKLLKDNYLSLSPPRTTKLENSPYSFDEYYDIVRELILTEP